MRSVGIAISLGCLLGMFVMIFGVLPKYKSDRETTSQISKRFAAIITPLLILGLIIALTR
jgi:hypothetical protein